MDIDSYSVNKTGIKGLVKSPAIWGHKDNVMFPLVYLRKPKHMSEKDWQEVLEGLRLEIRRSK